MPTADPLFSEVDQVDFSSLEVPQFFVDAVTEVRGLRKFALMVGYGITITAKMPEIASMLEKSPAAGKVKSKVADLRKDIEELSPDLDSEINADFRYLSSLLIVRLVTILESVVSDAVAWSFRTRPEVMRYESVKKLRGPIAEILAASDAERAEFLTSLLAQETKAPLKTGIGRYEILLEAVGLSGGIDEEARRALLELVEVRNNFVHRNGRADAKLVERCPWLNVKIGAPVVLNIDMLDRYRAAVGYYLLMMLGRWARICGHSPEDHASYQTSIANALANLRPSAG